MNNQSADAEQSWVWGLDEHHSKMAAHTTTDPVTLAKMVDDVVSGRISEDQIYEVSWELCYNKLLPFCAANKLAKFWRPELDFGFQLFTYPDATPEALDEWAADTDDEMALSLIADHPNTRLQTLLKLTHNPRALCFVLHNPRLAPQLVDSFSANESAVVRKVVASVSQDQSTLKKLASDPNPAVRLAVAKNPSCAATIINELARTEQSPSLELGKLLADLVHDEELLAKLASHTAAQVRIAVARNPCTSMRTITEMALQERHPCAGMCNALAKRLRDPALVQALFERSVVVQVISKGTTQITTAQHDYRITLKSLASGCTKVEIFADGNRIGERITYLPTLFASIGTLDQPHAIAPLRNHTASLPFMADPHDKVQPRDAAANPELDGIGGRCRSYGDRDKNSPGAEYPIIAKAEAKLTQLRANPLKRRHDVPFIDAWHQKRERARRPTLPRVKIVDILEISLPREDQVMTKAH